MVNTFETTLEQTTLDWFFHLGWDTAFGSDISPDGTSCGRNDYDMVVLIGRHQNALENSNPNIPLDAEKFIEEAKV